MSRAFFDTNVLIYVYSGEPEKAARARSLIAGGGVISVQVLNEFAHVARRKLNAPWGVVRDSLAAMRANLDVHPVSLDNHELGLALSERYRLGVFDGQLLAAATLAACDVFFSEDLQGGMRIAGGPTIRNPFIDA